MPESVGSLRIKFRHIVENILPLDRYSSLLKVIAEESYLIPVLFGKVSTNREDAAWSLVKITLSKDDAVNFINAVITHEVRSTRTHILV